MSKKRHKNKKRNKNKKSSIFELAQKLSSIQNNGEDRNKSKGIDYKEKTDKEVSNVYHFSYGGKKECHKPKFVTIGNHQVFICGLWDYKENKKELNETISKLDLFIGLDDAWEKYLRFIFPNKFVNKLYKKFGYNYTLSNLFVYHIPDRGIDLKISKEVLALLTENKKLKIGFGCLAGHGRSGWLLGYLIQKIEGLNGKPLLHAIRDRYCLECLESMNQFKSLGLEDFYKPCETYNTGYGYNWKNDNNSPKYLDSWKYPYDDKKISEPKKSKTFLYTCQSCSGQGYIDGYKCIACQGIGYIEETI